MTKSKQLPAVGVESLITPERCEQALKAAREKGSVWSHAGQVAGVKAAMLAVLPEILTQCGVKVGD